MARSPARGVNTVYIGSSEFSLAVLAAAGRHLSPDLVVTRAPAAKGRGRRLAPTPLADGARELGLTVIERARLADAAEQIAAAAPDLLVLCAYGGMVREPLLSRYEILNVHPSLLPRWRGAAPIERAILAGDLKTGVSLMRLVAELDAGPVCASAAVAIEPDDDFAALSARLAALAGELLTSALEHPRRYVEQDGAGVTYAEKLTAADRELDGGRPAHELERRVRALHPHVGARLPDGLGVLSATLANRPTAAGILAADGGRLYYGASPGTLELLRVQPPGKRAMDAAAYLRGHAL
jgi:methionyl-tRNA formyltransferase